MAGEDDDGEVAFAAAEFAEEFFAGHAGHAEIEEEAALLVGVVVGEEGFGGEEGAGLVAGGLEEDLEGLLDASVIVDNVNQGVGLVHGRVPGERDMVPGWVQLSFLGALTGQEVTKETTSKGR